MCEYLMGLASLAQAVNQYELAVRLLGAIDLLARTLPLHPIERQDYSRIAGALGAHLDAEQWDAALTTGRTQPFAQIAEEAVSILEEVLDVKMQAVSARRLITGLAHCHAERVESASTTWMNRQ